MSLSAGQMLSHYRLAEPIGEGGMGVVWRATDSTLARDVAIKVLPDLFAGDPERLARFEREARLLAALNHPHIASIYGLHSSHEGVRFLAMELVEGEDMGQRLARGPVPLAEALPLALQIAQALEHAHERGVIHRDLKPANVKLTAAGQAKVLDFGLAKALEGEAARTPVSALSQSPTITGPMTGANVILGTAAYMSPEQARGRIADKRADVWAFGVVLYEMLTGRRLFEGETVSDTLASVLKTDPDWDALPNSTPRRVATLLRRCLDREPARRLRDIGEARIALEDVLAGGAEEVAAPAPAAGGRRLPMIPIAVGALLLGVLGTLALLRLTAPPARELPVRKFRLSAPTEEGVAPASPAISPDGRTVAYLFGEHLWVQPLTDLEPKQIPIEKGAGHLFWSPDGKWIGYIAGTRVMKTAVDGSAGQVVCDTRGSLAGGSGACWREDGHIVFSRADSAGLLEVSALGGDPRVLVPPDSGQSDLHDPSVLPGGRGLLFCAHRHRGGINNITLWANGKRTVLVELEGQTLSHPVYSPSGHILFRRNPTTPGIWALPFSLSQLAVTGEPFLVAPEGAHPSVADDGTLAHVSGGAAGATQLAWVGRDGKELATIGPPESQSSRWPSLSPDGRRVGQSVDANDNVDLWIYDTARDTRTRLTFDPGTDDWAAWSPDGRRIAHHAQPKGLSGVEGWSVLLRAADGTGSADTVAAGVCPDFTPDGRQLLYVQMERGGAGLSIAEVGLEGPRTPRVIVHGNPRAAGARLSPSAPLMAYMSDESGTWEVYLTRYPSGEGRWQVSTAGGQWPRWSGKGDRLFFVQGDDVMEVEVSGAASPVLGTPRRLFTRPALGTTVFGWVPAFDVTRDGDRFLLLRAAGQKGVTQGIAVVQNWAGEFAGRK